MLQKKQRYGMMYDDGEFEKFESLMARESIESDIPSTFVDKYGVYQAYVTIHGGKEVFGTYEVEDKGDDDVSEGDFGHKRGIRNYKNGSTDPTDEWNAKMPKNYVNLEATAYFKISKPRHDDTISIKLRGPTHSNGNGSWYILGTTFYQGEPHFEKEYNHDKGNEAADTGNKTRSVGSIVDKWIGIKAITITDGKKVHCQCYVDTEGLSDDGDPVNYWIKILDVMDSRKPILRGNQRKGGNSLQIQFRVDGCGKKNSNSPIEAKFMSCRQI